MRVEENEGGARVVAEADVDLTGRAAQMGRGIVEDVATRLVGEMAACLEAGLAGDVPAGDGPPAPLEGGRLMLGAARDRAGDPRTLLALAASLTLIALLVMGIRRRRRDA